ncbi:unnamed protein product [Lampetra planeri]
MSSRRAHTSPQVGVPAKVLPGLGVQTQELLPKAPEDAEGSFAMGHGACALEAQGVSSRRPPVPEPLMPDENWQKPHRRLRHVKALASSQKALSKQSPTSPQVRRRAKRFIYPGTLWCGPGTNANSFDELGSYKKTDICCREHDHCPHSIGSFEHKYGYNNIGWHTISHCDCDNKFRNCMKESNDTAAWDVGRTYFSIVGVPCFTLREDEACVDWIDGEWCLKTVKIPVTELRKMNRLESI